MRGCPDLPFPIFPRFRICDLCNFHAPLTMTGERGPWELVGVLNLTAESTEPMLHWKIHQGNSNVMKRKI